MGVYNRLRVLVMDSSVPVRDSDACRHKYDLFFHQGYYAGYQVHPYNGPNPAHFYLFDDPSDDLVAQLLIWSQKQPGLPVRVFREYIGSDNQELTFNTILNDVARILQKDFVEHEGPESDTNQLARCWSGVKVLALAAGAQL